MIKRFLEWTSEVDKEDLFFALIIIIFVLTVSASFLYV